MSLLSVLDGLIVAGASIFYDVVMIFGVSFETDFIVAISALEVESKDFNAKVSLLIAYLHSHVELGADVQIVRAHIAAQ